MWYYESNQQPFGPVSKEVVAEALRTAKINESTLVWREGMAEWKRLAETELAVLVGGTPPAVIENIPTAYSPAYTNIPQTAKVKPESLNKLFWWWFGLLLASIPFYVVTVIFPTAEWAAALLCVYYFPIIAAAVLQYLLTYRFWQIIQDGFQRTTAGKAVGFLFIPFFNLYWYFVAFFGLSKDTNSYVDRHFSNNFTQPVRKTKPALSLCFVILMWIQNLFTFYIYAKIVSATMASLGNVSTFSEALAPVDIPTIILYFVHLGLLIATFFDYFQTAKSILAAEVKQP
jgi:hypothetical protein